MTPGTKPLHAWVPSAAGVTLRVRAQPGAGRDGIAGLETRARGEVSLKVRVKAQAEKGKANQAVIETLAKALGLARSRLSLQQGATARTKLIAIKGDPEKLSAALERLVSAT